MRGSFLSRSPTEPGTPDYNLYPALATALATSGSGVIRETLVQARVLRPTTGKITTAVPMFAMISGSSSGAPRKIRLSCPVLAMPSTGTTR